MSAEADDAKWAWADDRMEREGVAEFLAKYLDSNDKIKVLNINAPWGAGKTYFLNNWLLSQKDIRACVYFNAWENDFTGDAFVSLVSVIREQLKAIIGVSAQADSVVKEFTNKAAKAVIAATPMLIKGVVKKFTGADLTDIAEIISEDDLGDAAEKAVESLITSNRKSLDAVKDFKKVFHELLVAASNKVGDGNLPVYIFIDELDRCRPTFSIELLERLKHLFDAPDCKFIIATDTAQLAQAIKAVYGAGFNSQRYLKRFFDSEFTLKNEDLSAWVKVNFSLLKSPPPVAMGHALTDPSLQRRTAFDGKPVAADKLTVLSGKNDLDSNQVIFLALIKTFQPQLRELESILLKIKALQTNVGGKEFYFFWAAYLVFLKEECPDVYQRTVRGGDQGSLEDFNRFADVRLSYYETNTSVHDIFKYYLNLFKIGKIEAHKYIERSRNITKFISVADTGFFNEYEVLASYPDLVDLSHSLN